LSDHLDIVFEENDRAGVITLNRPSRLNALTREMFDALSEHYRRWAANPHIYGVVMQSAHPSVFCSGGDLKVLNEWIGQGATDSIREFYRAAYSHVWVLEKFIRPNVPLIDGLLLGGGIGITLYGTHCIAGENFRMAMPQVGIGFLPDIGGTYFLSQLPNRIGTYLALTGRELGRADAHWCRLVSHCIPAAHFPVIKDAIADNHPIDRLLDGLHKDPGEGELIRLIPTIDRIFAADSVVGILEGLDAERGEQMSWARDTAAEMRKKSPTSLKVAFRQMQIGRSLDLAEALRLEFRLMCNLIGRLDYREGIAARIAGKGRAPVWSPAKLDMVNDDLIESWFSLPVSEELNLEANGKTVE
jgi:enoyl-CoA hydratase/carnithine racemase